MRKQIFLIAMISLLSTLLLSCEPSLPNNYPDAQISKTDAGNTLIVTEDFSALILTKEFMDDNAPWVPPPGYWTPEIDQVLFIESNLEEYLVQHNSAFNSNRAPNKEKLSTFGRQYIGVIQNNGKKQILGSYFCSHFSKEFDWQNQVVSVMGGGDCFFGVWWDADTHEFIVVGANSPK